MSDVTFELVKSLVEQMPSAEVERLRAWLNMEASHSAHVPDSLTWGQRLVALVNQFDLSENDQMNITDPEAWVHEQRRSQTQKRNPRWGSQLP